MSPDHLCSDFEVAVALGALDARQGLIECRYWLASFERRANVLEAQTTQCTSHLSDGSSNSDIRKKSSNTQRSEDGSSSSRISASKDNENDGSTCVDSQKEPAQVRAVRRLEYNPGANLTVTLDAAWRLAAAQGAPLVLTERSAPSNSGASNANADDDADTVNLSSLQSTKEAATVAWLRAACSGAVADDFGLRGRGYAGTAAGGFTQTNGQTFPAATDPSAPPEWGLGAGCGTETITVEDCLTTTIKQLKDTITSRVGLPANKSQLKSTALGFLKDHLTVAHYNLKPGEVLEVSRKKR
jgi:hypothetical protein